MAKRKVREITEKTRQDRVKSFIGRYKFLKDPKYYKTNKVSVAAWDSWAAQGTAGGCVICPAGYHIHSVKNKRYTTTNKDASRREWYWQKVGGDLCDVCYRELEKQCNYEFNKF